MIGADHLARLLRELLPAHLVRQRWSGAQEKEITSIDLRWLELPCVGDPLLAWSLVDATFVDGSQHTYQVFVGGRPATPLPDFLHGKERELVGFVTGDGGAEVVLFDALVDPDLAIEVLHLVAPDVDVEVRRPIVLEHSNSSVVYDEARILKLFRKVEGGANPDVEITRVLAERGFPDVLPPLAELQRDETHLAVLREFLVGATEAWQLARTSVRDLLASRLPPEECGGDLAPNMERLGATIAALHVAMADAWGRERGDGSTWLARMEADIDRLLAGDGRTLEPGSFDSEAVRRHLRTALSVPDVGQAIRIHGDLHLGQAVRSDARWVVIDFEGEPVRIPEGRYTVSSPLRDVAGILRSFHYAATSGLAEWDEGDGELSDLLVAWEDRNRSAFLSGYLGHDQIGPLLPVLPAHRDAVLTAFEIDKAVYEIGYELAHRPDSVHIPLEGVARLLLVEPMPG